MQHIGKSKIGKLSAKKDKIYAQIRLPLPCADAIGHVADIFETEHNGKRAFLLVTDHSVLDTHMVLQPDEKVVKLEDKNHIVQRLQDLEREISELKSLLLFNESASFHKNKNRWARPDSNRRPPPCEGDVITS